MKSAPKTLKNPFMTTTWPLNDRADVRNTLNKLSRKLFVYGILSDREQAYWNRHNTLPFGKTDQKEVF